MTPKTIDRIAYVAFVLSVIGGSIFLAVTMQANAAPTFVHPERAHHVYAVTKGHNL